MLKEIFGSEIKARLLLYIYANGESYPTEMARLFGFYLSAVQNHLLNLEKGGLLYSRLKGRTRLFGLNPRYPFKKELEALLEKALAFLPEEERPLYIRRLRPRRAGKPL